MLLSLLKSLHPYVRFSSLPKIFITYRERGGVNGLKEEGGERIGCSYLCETCHQGPAHPEMYRIRVSSGVALLVVSLPL